MVLMSVLIGFTVGMLVSWYKGEEMEQVVLRFTGATRRAWKRLVHRDCAQPHVECSITKGVRSQHRMVSHDHRRGPSTHHCRATNSHYSGYYN